jgi:hypothetical protein
MLTRCSAFSRPPPLGIWAGSESWTSPIEFPRGVPDSGERPGKPTLEIRVVTPPGSRAGSKSHDGVALAPCLSLLDC